ncbi:TNFAIP3-interacting protein 1-like [Cololabis saira]|uniref:TNFAIP3-interacting protein 1-like n=1 Tax=Cololabis saira TaxID=129043 RepID=UPI002AD4E94A|nr:TNFAIP3-interacting protein 1-like [Cololabis saira]
MDRPPVKKLEFRDASQTHRFRPSQAHTDRYEVCLPVGSAADQRLTAAEFHPDVLRENTQLEEFSQSSDVSLKTQILMMEEQRKELLSINKKWAKEYRTMVQYYKEKVQLLKALEQHDQSEEETSDEQQKDVTLCKKLRVKTDTWTGGEGEVNGEFPTAEREAKALRLQNSSLTRRGQHQHEEIQRLNKALEEALLPTQPHGTNSETLQHIWKHQADVYKEDFLKERKDREKLHERYLELEKRFRKVHNELRVLKSEVTWNQPVQRCSCTNQAKGPNHQHIQRQRR